MDAELKAKLERVRGWLQADAGRVVVAAVCGAAVELSSEVPQAYAEFLKVSDGARFGELDLWSCAGLEENRWVVGEEFRGWTAIGQLVYEPLLMGRDGAVVLTPNHGAVVRLGGFDDFLGAVLGEGYKDLFDGAQESRWFEALLSMGLR